MLQFGYKAALCGLALAIVEAVYPAWPFALSSIYFSFCWLVWLVCAVGRQERRIGSLLGLWMLIDAGILVHLAAFVHTGHGPRPGDELLYVFSFAPVIFPSGLALSGFTEAISSKWEFWQVFGSTLAYVLPDWTRASLMAAVQSFLILAGRRTWTRCGSARSSR
jgi:hypothetical protein